jgi:hypothetical protein
MNGSGKMVWKDKRVYEGFFVNDKREGEGWYKWTDGREYRGGWKNGK